MFVIWSEFIDSGEVLIKRRNTGDTQVKGICWDPPVVLWGISDPDKSSALTVTVVGGAL